MKELTCPLVEDLFHNHIETSLQEESYAFFTEAVLPLTTSEWLKLEHLLDERQLPFSRAQVGDTKETASVSFFRIKKPGEERILHAELMNLVGSEKMVDFYRKICNNERLEIDRCQAHLYKTGDFVAYHVDKESYSGYLYSLLFYLSDGYTGGEMVMYIDGQARQFSVPKYTLLVADSGIPHEVLPVKSGVRKTLAVFLNEP